MTSDTLLASLALVELVEKLGGTTELDDYGALLGGDAICCHASVALYLSGLVCHIAQHTDFPLTELIAKERAEAIAAFGEEPGMA